MPHSSRSEGWGTEYGVFEPVGEFDCAALCDTNLDGVCNTLDARLIQRAAVGELGEDDLRCSQRMLPELAAAEDLLCGIRDVAAADDQLAAILAMDPAPDLRTVETATVLRSVTRLLRLPLEATGDPGVIDTVSEFLDGLGVDAVGRNPLAWTASLARGPNGACIPPEGLRETDAEAVLVNEVLPALEAALASLESISESWTASCRWKTRRSPPSPARPSKSRA